MAVWMHLADFRRQRPEDSFRGWLWKITKNKIRDGWREPDPPAVGGTAIQRAIAQVPCAVSDEIELVVSDKEVVMRQALDLVKLGFEGRTWRAFWRVTVDDCAAADVAAELKMTVGAVYQAKYKVLHRLRDEMEGLLD
jgi:RNA polymerase sigma-70 factor (ECF subfamily)